MVHVINVLTPKNETPSIMRKEMGGQQQTLKDIRLACYNASKSYGIKQDVSNHQ